MIGKTNVKVKPNSRISTLSLEEEIPNVEIPINSGDGGED